MDALIISILETEYGGNFAWPTVLVVFSLALEYSS